MLAKALVFTCLVAWSTHAGADPVLVIGSDRLYKPIVVHNPVNSTTTVIFEQISFSISVKMRLWATQSSDGGITWSAPQMIPLGVEEPIPSSFWYQEGASMLLTPTSGYVLFQHFRIDSPSNIWRSTSMDGISFAAPDLVDLWWPPADDTQPGTGNPSAVLDGATSIALLHQRFVADGTDPAGIYLGRSPDLGVSWSPSQTVVALDAQLGNRASLAYQTLDGVYAAA